MRSRLIPVLLVDRDRRLVKTIRFGERTYVGDPFNVIRLFNEKEVDELCVLDIDASRDGREPDLGFLSELASECFMPLSYGGAISRVAQAERLCRAGIEKLVVGSHALDADLIAALARDFGAQAVVACIDFRGSGDPAKCFVRNATRATGASPVELARRVEQAGVGEIILQSVDRDGARGGLDLELIRSVSASVAVPLVALGGAGEVDHLVQALKAGASAAASGSTFVFIGRLRAVLVSYPGQESLQRAGS